MSERPTRIARGAKEDTGPSTNLAIVRGHLVAQPTVRVIDRHQRATTFDPGARAARRGAGGGAQHRLARDQDG
jgi:hypothetical protein